VRAGVTGVIPCGTTGESPTLTLSEKKELILTTVRELQGTGLKTIAGTGTHNTAETVELSSWAAKQGVDGIMLVTPYYNKPSQAGLEAHFLAVADAVDCDIVLYNVPGRTSVSLTAETIVKLAAHPRINSLKEATANSAFTSEIFNQLSLSNLSLDILSGDDATFLPLLSIGAAGVISVASNLFPKGMVEIFNLMQAGKNKEALNAHNFYYPLFRDLFVESNPVPIKYAMSTLGVCSASVRLPLTQLSEKSRNIVNMSLKHCKMTKGTPV